MKPLANFPLSLRNVCVFQRSHVVRPAGIHSPAGISLLEVLISIGLLTVGLLATLSLIPAGRTYLKKANVDDRAAALVPNAYETMMTMGLFRQSALSWRVDTAAPLTFEPTMLRGQAIPAPVFTSSSGVTLDSGWTIIPPPDDPDVTETVQSWHDRNLEPRLAGTIQNITDKVPRELRLTTSSSDGTADRTQSLPLGLLNRNTGAWAYQIPANTLPPIGKNRYETAFPFAALPEDPSATPPYFPFVDYRFRGKYLYTTTDDPAEDRDENLSITPASHPQYGQLREISLRTGRATTNLICFGETAIGNKIFDYASPAEWRDDDTFTRARPIAFSPLDSTVYQQRIVTTRSSTRTIQDQLWRTRFGIRAAAPPNPYEQDIRYPNSPGAPDDWRRGMVTSTVFPNADLMDTSHSPVTLGDIGYGWSDDEGQVPPRSGFDPPGPVPPEGYTPADGYKEWQDIDCYQWAVESGQVLDITWRIDPPYSLAPNANPGVVFLESAGRANLVRLLPYSSSGNENVGEARFQIPSDGVVFTKLQLADTASDSHNLHTFPGGATRDRTNAGYTMQITNARNDRVVVVDPLMATRLDSALASIGQTTNRNHPLNYRRRRFADFQQRHSSDPTPRSFVIPRLSWEMLSGSSFAESLAMAEAICRGQDDVATEEAISLATGQADPDSSPRPAYDRVSGLAKRRSTEGRMSWLMTLQPEAAGSVQANWRAGSYFDANIVIFEDRQLYDPTPDPAALPQFDGEYAFQASWSDADGMVHVEIPLPFSAYGEQYYLDDEEIRLMFQAGNWILLAPQITYDQAPIDSRQRLDWIRIQTVELEKPDSSKIIVRILPTNEPDPNILVRDQDLGTLAPGGRHPIVALVYRGVVAVINKKVRLEP